MTERAKLDRPAKNPGCVQCERCEQIFIGEKWHAFCAICIQEVADEIAAKQGRRDPVGCVQEHGKD